MAAEQPLYHNHPPPSFSKYYNPPIRLRFKIEDYDSDSASDYSSSSESTLSHTLSNMRSRNSTGNWPKLQEYGWQIVKTIGDGNCLFRAIVSQLTKAAFAAYDFAGLRTSVVQEMETNSHLYKPFMAFDPRRSSRLSGRKKASRAALDLLMPSEKDVDQMYESRLKEMGKEGTWGDHLEIQAFCNAHLYNVVLFVELGAPEPLIFHPCSLAEEATQTLPTVYLAFHRFEHYSSIKAVDATRKMPATITAFKALNTSRASTPASVAPSLTDTNTAPSTPSSSFSGSETPEPVSKPKLKVVSKTNKADGAARKAPLKPVLEDDEEEEPVRQPNRKRAHRVIEDDEDEEPEQKEKPIAKPTIKRIRLIVRG